MEKPQVEIWTDGSSRGNPGPGGYGAVLVFQSADGKQVIKELSAGYQKTTNNRMEMMAAIAALEALKVSCTVHLHSDSQYLVKAHAERWLAGWAARDWKTSAKKPVKNVDLWKRLLAAEKPHDITYEWVPGHAGVVYNERCDELATEAACGHVLLEDAGFEASS